MGPNSISSSGKMMFCRKNRGYFCTWFECVAILVILVATPAWAQQENSPQANSQGDSAPDASSQTGALGAISQNPQPTHLQSLGNPVGLFEDFAIDEYRMWSSPFRFEDYSAHTVYKYGLPFLGISAALIATDGRTTGLIPAPGSQVYIWSGRVSQIGAPYTLAAATATLWLVSDMAHEQHLTETGLLSLEAFGHSQLIAEVFKEIAQRQRPQFPEQAHSFFKGGSSFYSGHATGSFSVATVVSYEYGHDYKAVPFVAYGLATVVDAARVGSREHWLSDVFVGSGMGFLEGRFIYRRHHDPNLPGTVVKPHRRLFPDFDLGARGGTLFWKF